MHNMKRTGAQHWEEKLISTKETLENKAARHASFSPCMPLFERILFIHL